MSNLTDFPSKASDEAATFDYALTADDGSLCPYFYQDNMGNRFLDSCMNPDECSCWRIVQLSRLPMEELSLEASSREAALALNLKEKSNVI